MASYEIPETVLGVPLFVPSANDFFEIESGGMPNGDSCLIVHGETSTDYKAFFPCNASVTDYVFRNGTTTPWAMSLWFKSAAHPSSLAAGIHRAQIIGGIFSDDYAGSGTTFSTSDYWTGSTGAMLWALAQATGTNGIGFFRVRTNNGTPASFECNVISTYVVNEWNLIVVNVAYDSNAAHAEMTTRGQTAGAEVGPVQDIGGSSTSTGTISTPRGLYFSLGSYTDTTTHNGKQGIYRLGKLAFHDHRLNATERNLLYHAMVG